MVQFLKHFKFIVPNIKFKLTTFYLVIYFSNSLLLGQETNSFDKQNYLTKTTMQDGSQIIFQYDKLGNRVNYQIIAANPCTYIVSNTNDSGNGSLRKAIECASPGDTVIFSTQLKDKTISLTSSFIEINKSLVLKHQIPQFVRIKALFAGTVFKITNGSTVSIENLQLESGNDSQGRAIINDGNLTLNNIIVVDSNIGSGASIKNDGSITIQGNSNIINCW